MLSRGKKPTLDEAFTEIKGGNTVMKSSSLVQSRRRFLLNVLPAGTVFYLGSPDSVYLETTKGQPIIKDERLKVLWNEGVQFMQKGYT